MYVRRKGWPVQDIDIDLSHERVEARDGKERQDIFRVNILVKGDLSEEQRERLKYIASRCPVHRTLTSPPQIIEELEVERPTRD